MTINPTSLTRVAGVAAVLAGAIFIGVNIGHPHRTSPPSPPPMSSSETR